MKKFAPEMEIVRFHAEDVLATSGGIVVPTQWWQPKAAELTDVVYWNGKEAYTWSQVYAMDGNSGKNLQTADLSNLPATGNGTKPTTAPSDSGWYHVSSSQSGGKNPTTTYTYTPCDHGDTHFELVQTGLGQ